jgi:Na+/melibiose symporter-like transporter
MVTFFTTRERVAPAQQVKSSPKQDFADLLKNAPWVAMVAMTLVHFAILSYRGGALYNYYHHYADRAAMFDFVSNLGLTSTDPAAQGGFLDFIGYRVRGDASSLATSNVADVFNSIINVTGTLITIVVILLSPSLARRFGKKAVAIAGFGLSALVAAAFYSLSPTDTTGMWLLTVLGAIVYAPTIPLVWAIYADVADYSEWQTGRRFTGMVFASIGFALKTGLALGSAGFLWVMVGAFGYDTTAPADANAVAGYRASSSLVVAVLFAICTLLLVGYKLGKKLTQDVADELAARRDRAGVA